MNPPSLPGIVSVARKDFRDARRSKVLWVLIGMFTLWELAVALLAQKGPGLIVRTPEAASDVAYTVAGNVVTLIAFFSILVAYRSIAGERSSGSITFLLSLPNARSDVVLGKVLGRGVVLAIPIAIGMSVGTVVGWIMYGGSDLLSYLIALAAIVTLGFVYASIVVGLSALFRSPLKVIAAGILFLAAFHFFWGTVPMAVHMFAGFIVNGEFPAIIGGNPADWLFLVDLLSPGSAYEATIDLIEGRPAQVPLTLRSSGSKPFYVSNWAGPVMLTLWAVVPLAIGYLRFETTDL